MSEENILKAILISGHISQSVLPELAPQYADKINLSVDEKLSFLNLTTNDIFPLQHLLGKDVDAKAFTTSHLIQPDLFLRGRKNKLKLSQDLSKQNIAFTEEGNDCLRLATATNLKLLPGLNRNYVVQDKSSQQVFNFLKTKTFSSPQQTWDACCASGGKSILLFDVLSLPPQLTLTDIRKQILVNGRERLATAGIPVQRLEVADLEKSTHFPPGVFDIIICDVPCSGSGTWSRSPEQLFFTTEEMVDAYRKKQTSILKNVLPSLKKGGLLFYITCSAFAGENEEQVQAVVNDSYHCLAQDYIVGYGHKANTLFSAVITRT